MDQICSSSSGTASSQKSLPSSENPGWNDPPEWALSVQHSSCEKPTKRLLNKRVAFPLSSQTSALEKASAPLALNIPPTLQSSMNITTASHKSLVTPIDINDKTETLESYFDKEQALMEILANLESVITEQTMEKNRVEEIQKRLVSMKSDWLKGKLNDTIQQSVLNVSQALLRKDIVQAEEIYLALMMQHATVCRTWMPAIRYIILHLKKECESYNILQSEH